MTTSVENVTSVRSRLLGDSAGEIKFRLRNGEHQGRVVRLGSAKCTIGSSPDCTLRLIAPGVRPLHCLIVRGEGGIMVRRWSPDTQLNGRAFNDAPLTPGDRLQIGPLELEFLEDQPPVPREMQSQASDAASRSPANVTNLVSEIAQCVRQELNRGRMAKKHTERRRKLAIARKRIRRLKADRRLWEERLAALQTEITRAEQRRLETLERHGAEIGSLRGTAAEGQSQCERLQAALELLRGEQTQHGLAWDRERREFEQRLAEKNSAIAAAESLLTETRRTSDRHSAEADLLRGATTEGQAQRLKLESELERLRGERTTHVASWDRERREFEQRLMEKDREIATAENSLTERRRAVEQLQTEIAEANRRLELQDERVRQLDLQSADLRRESLLLEEAARHRNAEADALRERIAELEAKLRDVQAAYQRTSRLLETAASSDEQSARWNAECVQLRGELETAVSERAMYLAALEKLREEAAHDALQQTRLREELESSSAGVNAECARLTDELAALVLERDAHLAELERLKADFARQTAALVAERAERATAWEAARSAIDSANDAERSTLLETERAEAARRLEQSTAEIAEWKTRYDELLRCAQADDARREAALEADQAERANLQTRWEEAEEARRAAIGERERLAQEYQAARTQWERQAASHEQRVSMLESLLNRMEEELRSQPAEQPVVIDPAAQAATVAASVDAAVAELRTAHEAELQASQFSALEALDAVKLEMAELERKLRESTERSMSEESRAAGLQAQLEVVQSELRGRDDILTRMREEFQSQLAGWDAERLRLNEELLSAQREAAAARYAVPQVEATPIHEPQPSAEPIADSSGHENYAASPAHRYPTEIDSRDEASHCRRPDPFELSDEEDEERDEEGPASDLMGCYAPRRPTSRSGGIEPTAVDQYASNDEPVAEQEETESHGMSDILARLSAAGILKGSAPREGSALGDSSRVELSEETSSHRETVVDESPEPQAEEPAVPSWRERALQSLQEVEADPLDAPLPPPKPAFSTPSSEPAEDDDSINDYMARLLKRVRGENSCAAATEQRPEPTPAVTQTAPIASSEEPAIPELPLEPVKPEDFKPRSRAPQLKSDLYSMRELALHSARQAVEQAQTQQHRQAIMSKFLGAMVSLLASGLMLHWGSKTTGWMPYLGAVVGVVTGVHWTVQAVFMMGRRRHVKVRAAATTNAWAAESISAPIPTDEASTEVVGEETAS